MKKKPQQKTVLIKSDLIWHHTLLYLEHLRGTAAIQDDEFSRLFQKLYNYVNYRIDAQFGGDIVDIYVMVERSIK